MKECIRRLAAFSSADRYMPDVKPKYEILVLDLLGDLQQADTADRSIIISQMLFALAPAQIGAFVEFAYCFMQITSETDRGTEWLGNFVRDILSTDHPKTQAVKATFRWQISKPLADELGIKQLQ